MKVKDLKEEIERCEREYGDFLEWDIYTEQINELDKAVKRGERTIKCSNGELDQSEWGKTTEGEGWEYFECAGFWTKMPEEKIFTVNVNY